MKKFAVILLSMVLLCGTLLAVCACVPSSQDDDKTITIWAGGQWVGTDLQNLKSFIKNYNETNTKGIKVEVECKSDMETALSTAVRNNKIPDILIWDRFNTPTYAKTNALLDITEYVKRDKVDTTLFNDEAMKELTYNDKIYGLPLDVDVWGLYINMDMVDSYNEQHPDDKIVLKDDWTWDDLYNIAKKLTVYNEKGEMTVAGYSGNVMHQHYFKYLCSTARSFIENGEFTFDSKEGTDILNFFKKVGSRTSGIWENGLTEKSNFTAEQLAIIDQSLYFTDYIERYNSKMNYKFMPQPRYSVDGVVQEGANNGGMLGGFGLAFPRPAEQYINDKFWAKFELSWDFTKEWLLSESMQLEWSTTTGTLPALKSLYTAAEITADTTLSRAASFVGNYKIRPQIPSYLTMQTQVVDLQIKAFTEGTIDLETVIRNLATGCGEYVK